MKIPPFTTENLVIDLIPTDIAAVRKMAEWLNDKEVVRYSEQRHRLHTITSQFRYIDSMLKDGHVLMGINLNGQLIGTISATIDWPNKVADMGILIGDKSQWGNGYGLEAWTALSEKLLKHGIRKIEAGCMEDNVAMMNICSRSGMYREGRRHAHFIIDTGELSDLVMWGTR